MRVSQVARKDPTAKLLHAAGKFFDQNRFSQCIQACLQGLNVEPKHLVLRELLALAYLQTGASDSALMIYRGILEELPNHFLATLNTAKIHINHQRFAQAKPLLFQCEETGKMAEEVQYLLGLCYEAEKDLVKAITRFTHILEINPKQAQSYVKLASCLSQLKHHKEALELLEAAQKILPQSQELLIGKALLLKEQGMNVAALEAFEKLDKLKPEIIEYTCTHAEHLFSMMELSQSLEKYQHILKIEPQNIRGLIGYGVVLTQLKHLDEAEVQFKRVLEIEPDNMTALTNMSTLTMMRRDLKNAWKYSKQLFEKNKDYAGQYLYQMCFHCDWQHYAEALKALQEDFEFTRSGPFISITFSDDPKINLGYAKKYSKSFVNQRTDMLGPIKPFKKNGKIRLGYYTCDFFNHATAILIEGLLQSHDRDLFELHAFSLDLRPNDAYNERIRKLFDHYHDVHHISDLAIAHMSRELGIDIAIDLKGYTEGARTGIFAARAAPIQVNFLGYPGTMGADYIDYIIADNYLITPETRIFYTENVVYMPECYQPNTPSRPKPSGNSSRPTELPENTFVFCSFNNSYKITPEQYRVWLEILKNTPDSVLWILSPPEEGKKNLIQFSLNHGIAPNRIIFAPYLQEAEHLERLTHADLFLDTFPCNAHTTASDALWAGVPVLTIKGKSFASRVASSLLNTCNAPELVTHNEIEYIEKAISLYNNKTKLNETKKRIKAAIASGKLYNIKKYTEQFERALLSIIENPKKDIHVNHLTETKTAQ